MKFMMLNIFGTNKDMKMNRIQWLDVLRGLTMMSVILGHCMMGNSVNRMILCFHMGLFYFISGMTFNPSSYNDLRNALKKKTVGIILPYLCFSIMGSVCYMLLKYTHLGWLGDHSLSKVLIGIVLPVGGDIGVGVTQGFWFVYDIIIIYLTNIFIFFCIKNKSTKYLLPIVSYLVIIISLNGFIMLARQTIGIILFYLGYLVFGNKKCEYYVSTSIFKGG